MYFTGEQFKYQSPQLKKKNKPFYDLTAKVKYDLKNIVAHYNFRYIKIRIYFLSGLTPCIKLHFNLSLKIYFNDFSPFISQAYFTIQPFLSCENVVTILSRIKFSGPNTFQYQHPPGMEKHCAWTWME